MLEKPDSCFGRIDRYEVLKAQTCSSCGQQLLATAKSIKIEKQSVAVLVEKPIEVVEYQRHHSLCDCCGEITSPNFCLFRGGDTRSRREIQEQLGVEYPGVIISDDFNVYNGYQVAAQQKCLAHLQGQDCRGDLGSLICPRRHFKRLTKTPGKYNKSIGLDLTELIDEAFVELRSCTKKS